MKIIFRRKLSGVFVTFRRKKEIVAMWNGTDGVQNTDESEKDTQKTLQKKHQRIISLLKANPHITTTELASQLKVSRQTIATNIKKLQEAGLLRRIGPDKGGHWEVIDRNDEPHYRQSHPDEPDFATCRERSEVKDCG